MISLLNSRIFNVYENTLDDLGLIYGTLWGSPSLCGASKNLKEWLQKVGLPFHSPHKFRHRHAVYALKNAKDIQALKAVSQNLMHANLSVTDGIYGILSEMDVREQITNLGFKKNANKTSEEILNIIKQLMENHIS